jgi:hypothetical protein
MSAQGYGTDITLLAAADLSAKQFYAVKVDSNGKAALAGAGEVAIGVLQNKPGSGQAATIRIAGATKMVASAAVAAGALVAANAAGKSVTATKATTNTSDAGGAADPLVGSHVMGVALTAAGQDLDVHEVLLINAGAVATTAA